MTGFVPNAGSELSDFPWLPLPEKIHFQEGPGILAKDFTDSGVPLVRLSGLGGYEVTLTGCNFVSAEMGSGKWGHFRLRRGDILVSTSASFGRPAVVGDEAEGALFYTGLIRFSPKTGDVDAGYLKAFLGSELFMRQAEAMASGSVIRHFGPSHLREMRIPLPPLPEQRAIAATLGALDDKIELNRKMNATLEAMARALFRDWFVDFGPTRAKMDGREPYLAPDLWALFPDRLNEETGLPEGWEERPLTEFLSIIGGGTPKTSNADFWGGPIPWFSVTDTPPNGSVFVAETEKTITHAGLNGSSARLVPKGTTIISARGTVGNLAVAGRDMTFNQSCYGLRGAGSVGDYATYLIAQNTVAQLQAMAHGSVFSTITRQTFESLSLTMPSDRVLRAFEDTVSPMFDKILANVLESRTLAQTRDLLLPKLMSGEIRFREADKAVEAVA